MEQAGEHPDDRLGRIFRADAGNGRPVRICQVLETGGGGTGRHVLDLSRELAARDHDVTLVYSPVRAEGRFVDELTALPVRAVPIEMHRNPSIYDIASARKLAAVLMEHGPFDILHGHSAKAGALARLVPSRGAARVYTPHAFRALDPEAHPLVRHSTLRIERFLGRHRTDALIAVSQGELEFAAKHRIARGRQRLIRNGVVQPCLPSAAMARQRLGLSPHDFVIGFVGRLCRQKAPERFVAVMAAVMRERPDVRALILGDGELRAEVVAAIERTGRADRFVQLSAANAQDYIAAFDLLLVTSRYEGLSYVMLESLAAGVPIVTTPVAGAADIMESGVEGLIVDGPDVVTALARAVAMLAGDRSRLACMAQAAKNRSDRLNGPRMIAETERLYGDLVRQRGSR